MPQRDNPIDQSLQSYGKAGRAIMEAMEAVLTRISVRKYRPDPVPEDTIRKILQAAMSAPSAGNEQPWHFVVVDDRGILDDIPRFHEYAGMLRGAPAAIVVCADVLLKKYVNDWWIQDCSAATQNALIAAHALGLGAVWLGVYPVEKRVAGLRRLLGLPENVTPLSIISVGFPAAERSPAAKRYAPSRIHRNKW